MRKLILLVGVLAIAGVTAAFMIRRNQPEWSTNCPEALTEFRAGLDDDMKLYRSDAEKHYVRALQLDPAFLVAKIQVAQHARNTKDGQARVEELFRTANLDSLNDRERLLIQYGRLQFAKQPDKADQLVTDYLSEHPRDSLVLNIRCDRIWSRLDLTSAERCYQKLIDTDPNFVQAQNRLGYIAMAQSRFKDAEDAFKTYRFIAPDQANPHDSLGELLTLVGRYDEARHELDEAVRVRPDFCASYQHMIDASLLDGRIDLARQVVTRTRQIPACAAAAAAQDCQIARWDAAVGNDWEKVIAPREGCGGGSDPVLRHLAMLRLNRTDDALAIEKEVAADIQKASDSKLRAEPTLLHLEGVRLLVSNDAKEAVEKFKAADSKLLFWGDGQGIMKLYNMLRLAEALDQSGDHLEAAATLKKLNDINPRFVKRFEAIPQR